MDGGDGPKRAYAELIVKIGLGVPVYDGEVDALPDPELFRDALILAPTVSWSPAELDATDALLLALIRRLQPRMPHG